jgi:hypothetical protein
VFGAGFLASEIVEIIEGSTVATTTRADAPLGNYSATFSVFRGHHTFHARGQTSERTSNPAGITV